MKPTRTFLVLAIVGALIVVAGAALGHPLWGLVAGSLPVVFGATPIADSDVVRQLAAWGVLDVAGGIKRLRVVPKTGNYTVLSPTILATGDASGTLFTNRGAAGAVTFTLPAASLALTGVFYDFVAVVAAQTVTVSAGAGAAVTFNNAAAASLAAATANQIIGAHIRATCDGVSWILVGDTAGSTYTVA